MKLTFGMACTSNCVYGCTRAQTAAFVKTDANGVAGLCLSAYRPEVVAPEHADGMSSS